MNRTGIEWCDYTWNPIVGCSPASEGCANCYARRMARRLAANPKLPEQTRAAYRLALSDDGREWARPACLTLLPERLGEPARVKKPARIFVCSMSDLGHDSVLQEWRVFILLAMLAAPWHTYIILSKRPALWMEVFDVPQLSVWLGVTAENQARANERIPELLRYPAALRFVSVEPMLGPVSVRCWLDRRVACGCGGLCDAGESCPMAEHAALLDWVIAGPETGPGARECRAEWIVALAEQCGNAGVPFFDKRKTWLRREWPGMTIAGAVPRRGSDVGTSPLLGMDSVAE
jgi:protein gp37